MRIAPQHPAFPPEYETHFGVGFMSDHAVHHMGAGLFQIMRQLDVRLFVETGP